MSDWDNPIGVKLLRLNTGEDIITDITYSNDKFVNATYPFKVLYAATQQAGYISIALYQWVFPKVCKSVAFQIKINDILLIADPSDEMMEQYFNHRDRMINPESADDQEILDATDDEFGDDVSDEEMEFVKNKLNEIANKKWLH